MNEWVSEWVSEWMHEWMNEQMNEWMDGCVSEWHGWVIELVNEWAQQLQENEFKIAAMMTNVKWKSVKKMKKWLGKSH